MKLNMKKEKKLNQEIDELSKVKNSLNSIKRIYQSMDSSLEIKKDLRNMIDILDKIYVELFDNPHNLQLFRMYGDFYLPTISKLLSRYNNLINKNINSTDVQKVLINIENSVKRLNIHFQNKYNSFFESEIIDLDADIKVLLKELSDK